MFVRLSRLAVIALALGALSGPVRAQTNPTNPTNPTNAGFVASDFNVRLEVKEDPIKKPDGPWIFPSTTEGALYFNRARCECDLPVAIRVDMTSTGAMKANAFRMDGTVQLFVGPVNCVEGTSNLRPPNMAGCTLLATLPALPTLAQRFHEVQTTVGALFRSGMPPEGKGCAARFKQYVLLWVDSDSSTNPDDGVAGANAPKLEIDADGDAPAPLSNIQVTPGNEALSVKWDRPSASSDVAGALVFCSRADLPVYGEPNPFYSPKDYFSRKSVCGDKVVQPGVAQISAAQNQGTPLFLPGAFNNLDPHFLCSNLLLSSTDWRIRGLQNGIKYVVGVASVDRHGNASPIENALIQAPVPTTDFYRGYREAGGEASGCNYGGRASGSAALLALAALALSRRRR